MPDFLLDPRLEADSIRVTELALSAVRLMRDATYPWLLLVPRRPGVVELLDLNREDRTLLMDEIALASEALRSAVACDKLNVATLGNMVRQLHVHVIARRRDDPAWPKAATAANPPKAYAPGKAGALAARLAARLK